MQRLGWQQEGAMLPWKASSYSSLTADLQGFSCTKQHLFQQSQQNLLNSHPSSHATSLPSHRIPCPLPPVSPPWLFTATHDVCKQWAPLPELAPQSSTLPPCCSSTLRHATSSPSIPSLSAVQLSALPRKSASTQHLPPRSAQLPPSIPSISQYDCHAQWQLAAGSPCPALQTPPARA